MIDSWTDLDYAQAAIDMLPGSVEEIAEFMAAQRITNKWADLAGSTECPLTRWIVKWVGYGGIGRNHVYLTPELDTKKRIRLPEAAVEYTRWVDGLP